MVVELMQQTSRDCEMWMMASGAASCLKSSLWWGCFQCPFRLVKQLFFVQTTSRILQFYLHLHVHLYGTYQTCCIELLAGHVAGGLRMWKQRRPGPARSPRGETVKMRVCKATGFWEGNITEYLSKVLKLGNYVDIVWYPYDVHFIYCMQGQRGYHEGGEEGFDAHRSYT